MSILNEIMRGLWLLETVNPQAYKSIANNILTGGQINLEKPQCYSIIGRNEMNSRGESELKDQVSVIRMIGEITKTSGMCNYGMDYICSEFLKAEANPDIKGHILMTDGPGGNADAMPLVLALKSQLKKPVVALVDRACSLHYWTICELAEHIMMSNDLTAEVGSIGAMIAFQKPANELIIIRPEESKDKNQAMIDAREGNYELLEQKLKPLAVAFQNGVKANRPQVKAETLHGKTYYAKEAIELGLADSIGDMAQAYQVVIARSELKKLSK